MPSPSSSSPTSLLLAVGVALLLWTALLAWSGRTGGTRAVVSPGPLTEPGPGPPAIADLLTGGWRLSEREASSATLLDLAARQVVAVNDAGPGHTVVRLRRHPDSTLLRPYERMVLEHVTRLSTDAVVDTEGLAEGAEHLNASWWKRFRYEVVSDARRLGLSRPRWTQAWVGLLTAVSVLPAAAVASWSLGGYPGPGTPGDDLVVATGLAVLVVVGLRMLVAVLNVETGTPLGVQAAAHWLGVAEHLAATGGHAERSAGAVAIWGRDLAYAAAFGLAPAAVTALPLHTGTDDNRAWSAYGGRWHPVEVHYRGHGLNRLLWGWRWTNGLWTAAVTAFFGYLVGAAWLILASGSLPTGPDRPAGVVLAGVHGGALRVAAWAGALPLAVALADRLLRKVVAGEVVRRRALTPTGARPGERRPVYWLALDDGEHRRVYAFATDRRVWAGLNEGDVVHALVGRYLGWVYRVAVVKPARPRPPVEEEAPPLTLPGRGSADPGVDRGGWADRARGESAAPVAPAALVTADDLTEVLGVTFGPAERIASRYDEPARFATPDYGGHAWAGPDDRPARGARPGAAGGGAGPDGRGSDGLLAMTACRYHSEAGITVEVHAVAGRRSAVLLALGMRLTGTEGWPLPNVPGAAMVWNDTVAVLHQPRGGCVVRVSSPYGPPGLEQMSAVGRAAAARLSTPPAGPTPDRPPRPGLPQA